MYILVCVTWTDCVANSTVCCIWKSIWLNDVRLNRKCCIGGGGADMEKSGREWVMPPPFSTIYLNKLLFEIYKYTGFFLGGGAMLNIFVKFDLMNKFKKRDTTFYTSIKNWNQNLVILCNRGLTFNIIESAKIKIFPIVTVNCIQNKQSNPKKVCNATNII